jgi:hypothetical protein
MLAERIQHFEGDSTGPPRAAYLAKLLDQLRIAPGTGPIPGEGQSDGFIERSSGLLKQNVAIAPLLDGEGIPR